MFKTLKKIKNWIVGIFAVIGGIAVVYALKKDSRSEKEFKAVLKDKIKDLKDTEKHYKRVQKLKEDKLNEVIQPKVGDFFEWNQWMKLGKIIKIDSKLIYVKPLKGTFGKAVDSVQFDIKKLKFRTSKDKPIWKPR